MIQRKLKLEKRVHLGGLGLDGARLDQELRLAEGHELHVLAEVLLDELGLDGGLEALLGGLQLAGNLQSGGSLVLGGLGLLDQLHVHELIALLVTGHSDDVDGAVVAAGEALAMDAGEGQGILGQGNASLTSHNSERAVAAGDLPGKIGRPVCHLYIFFFENK